MIRGRMLAAAAGVGAMALGLALSTMSCAEPARQASTYPGGRWQPGPARFGMVTGETTIVMDDGVRLRASIGWPADPATGQRAAGRFPVIVEQTPYVGFGTPIGPVGFFAERGYIHVVVHARGTGPSEGDVRYVGPGDGEDGRAVVDWAAHRLEGSDGRLALIGCSYPAGLALMTAAHLPAHSPVKAIVAACNGFHSQNRGSFMRAGMDTGNVATMAQAMPGLVGNTPSGQAFFPKLAAEIRAGGDAAYDRAFWQERLATPLAPAIVRSGIPVLLWSGWRDHVEGAVRTYTALQNVAAGSPAGGPMTATQPVSPRYQLLMGDWSHAQGLDLGVYLEWIETWLKGADTGMQSTTTPMHLFESGTERWVRLSRFPASAAAQRWHLAPGHLSRGSVGTEQGRIAQDEAGSRLRFDTPPFPAGATLAGPISATIAASSSNRNLRLVARLFDVAPDGTATEITTGSVLGSQSLLDEAMTWRDAQGTATWPWPRLDRDVYLEPGKGYRFDISLLSRMWGITPGHRLRLELSGRPPAEACGEDGRRAAPRTYNMYPCALNAPQQASVPGGVYTLRYGAQGSTLNLPLLPFRAVPGVRAAPMATAFSEGTRRPEPSERTLPVDW